MDPEKRQFYRLLFSEAKIIRATSNNNEVTIIFDEDGYVNKFKLTPFSIAYEVSLNIYINKSYVYTRKLNTHTHIYT